MGSQPEKQNGRVDLRPEEVIGDLGFTPMVKVADPWTVDKVVKEIPGGAPAEESSSPLPFFHMLERLKTTKREGWRRFGISR
jgi:putative hydrolases of HD superfamily